MKKLIKLTILPLLIGVLLAFKTTTREKITVVVDASHGGQETGVLYDSIAEKDIVLNIAKYLQAMSSENVEFIALRTKDNYVPLNMRIDMVNELKPDLVISLHLAQDADIRKKGAVAYVYNNTLMEQSKAYAESILSELEKNLFTVNQEIVESDFYLIKSIQEIPALVIDLGYLSNDEDREAFTKENTQQKVATSIANALNGLK